MKLNYTYVMDDGFYVGRLDDYPEYTTQGENLTDFEDALREIYGWVLDGTLKKYNRYGNLKGNTGLISIVHYRGNHGT